MRKILVLTLITSLLASVCAFGVSAQVFSDMAEEHWAYAPVQTLVADGTVSGYEDGSFRPNGTVTRAEFVKMLGLGSVARPQNYSDVAPEHWAYTYVMNASFPEDGTNSFLPDQPITRGLVAELLWNRGGKVQTDVFVPSLITSQYKKAPEAVAWVYTTGLIRGDGDGINLRLSDTLSRAEAATLIVRARSAAQTKESFAQIVNDEILKNVYNGLKLFGDEPYAPADTMTNGEMSRAVLRIGAEETNLTYHGTTAKPTFEHPYALDVTIVFTDCLGTDRASATFADKAANFGDTVAALTYQFISKSHESMIYGDMTEGLPKSITTMMNVCLTFAKNNGIISLKEDLNAPITIEEFTALCLLFDRIIGSQTDTSTIPDVVGAHTKTNHSLLLTPESYGDFRVMLEGMPAALYTTPFVSAKTTPAETYNFAREFDSVFNSILCFVKNAVNAVSGADIDLTYYPSLVCENEIGYTMRVACTINSLSGTKTLVDLFAVADGLEQADMQLKQGDTIYLDIATGDSIRSISASGEKSYVEQVISVQ